MFATPSSRALRDWDGHALLDQDGVEGQDGPQALVDRPRGRRTRRLQPAGLDDVRSPVSHHERSTDDVATVTSMEVDLTS